MAKEYSIKAIISAVDQFTDPMKKIAGKSLGDFARKTTSVGKGLTAGLTLPLVGVGIAAVKAATDINASMANVATLIPGSTDRVTALKKEVQDLSIETGKSTDSVAEGLFQVISAFGDSADTAATLGIAARAATAGLSTTTEAVNLLSTVTAGYGDKSTEALQKVSDLAFTTNKLGRTTFPELAASMGRVVPLATELGVAQEELFGVFATATSVSQASEVSTQFRGVLQSLLSPTKDMTDLIQGMGFESGKALLQQKGLKGTLDLIAKAADLTKTPISKFIGSIEGQSLALALTGAQAGEFTTKLGALQNVTGATAEAFKEQTEGVNESGFMIGKVISKVVVLSQRLGDGLAPVLFKVLDVVTPVIDLVLDLSTQFQTLDPTLQTVIAGAGVLAAVMGPVLTVVGALIPLIAAISAPVVLAVASIGLLSVIGFRLYQNWDKTKQKLGEIWDGIIGVFQSGVDSVSGVIDGIMDKVDQFTSGVAAVGNFLGFGGGNGPAPIGRPSGESVQSPQSALSALPAQAPSQVNGEIKVKFENAPPGTRIQKAGSNQSALDVITDMGTNMLNWATGG